MPNVKIGVSLGTPDAASAQMETGQAWSFRTGGGGGVLYSGSGAPSLSVGGIGDFYVDETDFPTSIDLYGPKADGDWGSPVTLGSGGAGATAFTDLTDVPASYAGQGSKIVSVKSTEDGLEFSNLTGEVTTAGSLATTINRATNFIWTGSHLFRRTGGSAGNEPFTVSELDANYSGGAPSNGFGGRLTLGIESTAADNIQVVNLEWIWTDVSAFNETSAFDVFNIYLGAIGRTARFFGSHSLSVGGSTTDPGAGVIRADTGFNIGGTPLPFSGGTSGQALTKASDADYDWAWSTVSGGATSTAHYVTTQAESGLSAEFNLGGLTTGLLKHTVAAGVSTPATATAGTDYLVPISSPTNADIVTTDGSGVPQDSGKQFDIDGTLAANSDDKIPTQKAVKTYVDANIGGGGAPDTAHYVTTQAEGGLSNEFNLGGLSDGLLKQTVVAGVATPDIAAEGTDYLAPARIDDTAYNATTWDGDTDHAPSKNAVRDKIESLSSYVDARNKSIVGATWYNAGDPVTAGKAAGFIAFPVAGTITAWAISVDTGTATIKVWKVATGTAVPDSSNSINTSGVSISSGTHVRSTTLTDFGANTGVTANDIFAFNLESVTGSPTEISFQLEIQK